MEPTIKQLLSTGAFSIPIFLCLCLCRGENQALILPSRTALTKYMLIEVGDIFSLDPALNIHEKGLIDFKNHIRYRKE